MKAIKRVTLKWEDITAPVKIVSLVKSKSIPKTREVHGDCKQEVKTENFCHECGKLFKSKQKVICPFCKEEYEPEIQKVCAKCEKPVKQSKSGKYCPYCEKKLSENEVKQVYPIGDSLMTLSEEEYQDWQEKFPSQKEIDVVFVVRRRNLNPLYLGTSYVLVPDKGGELGYEFFKEMISDNELILIAEVVISKKNYQAVVLHQEGYLYLITLISHDEIVWPEIPEVELPKELIERGREAIFKAAERMFSPEKHTKDPYRQHFEALKAEKIENRKVEKVPPRKPVPEEIKEITRSIQGSLKSLEEKKKKERENKD